MSYYPNDLAVAYEFAQQELAQRPVVPPAPAPAPAPVTAPAPEPKVKPKLESTSDTVSTSAASDNMMVDDTLDAAIAGEIKQEGYESSDIDLSSDEDEDSSSSESESDEEDEAVADKKEKKTLATEAVDEEEDQYPDGIVKTAHEIVDIQIEKPQYEVTPQTEIVLAGSIFQIIDNVIVVHCRPGGELNTLDQGSLLVYENREIMGEVFETFGPVVRPYYSVRFNDSKEINDEFAKVGAPVFYVPSYQKTQIVDTETLKKIKGTDASNVYDEEVGDDEMEFSDDEKEMEFKRKKNREKKMRQKGGMNHNYNQPPPPTRGRQHQQRREYIDRPDDFDSALAAYEQNIPPRQQQSYADLMDDYTTARPVQPQPQPPMQPQYAAARTYTHPQQQSYQSPADLVSALYKSFGGNLPTQLPPQTSASLTAAQAAPIQTAPAQAAPVQVAATQVPAGGAVPVQTAPVQTAVPVQAAPAQTAVPIQAAAPAQTAQKNTNPAPVRSARSLFAIPPPPISSLEKDAEMN